jgi:hypothetical protein
VVKANRNKRRPAPSAVLARVKAFSAKRMGHSSSSIGGEDGFGFRVVTASSAACKALGNFFPRFSARRSIPAHAVGLKKNLGGMEVCSSTCDNEHTLASLGESEVLSVQGSPRDCSLGSKDNTCVCPSRLTFWRKRLAGTGKCSKKASKCVIP